MRKALLGICDGQLVDLVEHHDGDVVVAGEPAQVLLVHQGVGVLLRIEHPHHQVDPLDEVVDMGAVRRLGGIVVGQVDQHQVSQRLGTAVGDMPAGDPQPLQQGDGLRGLLPDRRQRLGCGGPQHPRLGHLFAHDGVEQRALAGTGGSRECHHGQLLGQSPPGLRTIGYRSGLRHRLRWQPALTQIRCLGQTGQRTV